MKVLLAINDRDLLSSLDRLLKIKKYDTATAFDAVQAISLLSQGKYDIAVIDEYITLLDAGKIVKLCKDEFNIKTLVLKDKNSKGYSSDAEIIYPFVSEEFYEKLNFLEKTNGDGITDGINSKGDVV